MGFKTPVCSAINILNYSYLNSQTKCCPDSSVNLSSSLWLTSLIFSEIEYKNDRIKTILLDRIDETLFEKKKIKNTVSRKQSINLSSSTSFK